MPSNTDLESCQFKCRACSPESLKRAVEAMGRAKKLPIWGYSVPVPIHREPDIIFSFLSALDQSEEPHITTSTGKQRCR